MNDIKHAPPDWRNPCGIVVAMLLGIMAAIITAIAIALVF